MRPERGPKGEVKVKAPAGACKPPTEGPGWPSSCSRISDIRQKETHGTVSKTHVGQNDTASDERLGGEGDLGSCSL